MKYNEDPQSLVYTPPSSSSPSYEYKLFDKIRIRIEVVKEEARAGNVAGYYFYFYFCIFFRILVFWF